MKRIIYISLSLFWLSSCIKPDIEVENLNGNKISIYGHGGMGVSSNYPMNSLESITKCLSSNADGVEFDVQMTADSVLVAFHDIDLSENTDLNGDIANHTWEEIKNTKYKTAPYLSYKIVTVNSIFSSINNLHDYQYSMDCKVSENVPNRRRYIRRFANQISKIIQKYELINNAYVESNNEDLLEELMDNSLNRRLFIYSQDFVSAFQYAKDNRLFGISIPNDKITIDQIKVAHNDNLRVVIWQTRTKAGNRIAVEKDPDFIQTDQLKYLVRLLK